MFLFLSTQHLACIGQSDKYLISIQDNKNMKSLKIENKKETKIPRGNLKFRKTDNERQQISLRNTP